LVSKLPPCGSLITVVNRELYRISIDLEDGFQNAAINACKLSASAASPLVQQVPFIFGKGVVWSQALTQCRVSKKS
jgi:hypothetical protein